MAKLHQVLAAEKTVKSRANKEITSIHRTLTKSDLFDGFTKNYEASAENEDGTREELPSESKRPMAHGEQLLKDLARHFSDLFDVTATRDYANLEAVADVVIGGKVIVEKAPATFLLFLEKQLLDVHTALTKLPVLNPAEDWNYDPNTATYKTEPKRTQRQVKEPRVITLAPATDKHPAQVHMEHVNKTVGHWHTIAFSTAFPRDRAELLVERVVELQKAVKYAREQANSVEAPDKKVGEAIFNYLLAK